MPTDALKLFAMVHSFDTGYSQGCETGTKQAAPEGDVAGQLPQLLKCNSSQL